MRTVHRSAIALASLLLLTSCNGAEEHTDDQPEQELLETTRLALDTSGTAFPHQKIAHDAVNLIPSTIAAEFLEHRGEVKRYCSNPISSACDPSNDFITAGADEEDQWGASGSKFLLVPPQEDGSQEVTYFAHFWDSDDAWDSGLVYTDYSLPKPVWYYTSALEKALLYWDSAKQHYSQGNKALAYYWLGHVAHLLADTGVPAHVLLDPHPLGDGYESYVSDALEDHPNWTSGGVPKDMSNLALTPPGCGANYDSIQSVRGLSDDETMLFKLFVNLAEEADNYDSFSDDLGLAQGTCDDATELQGGINLCHHYNDGGFPNKAAYHEYTASWLIPLTYRYTASLYLLFWQATHAPTVQVSPLNGNLTTDCIDQGGYGFEANQEIVLVFHDVTGAIETMETVTSDDAGNVQWWFGDNGSPCIEDEDAQARVAAFLNRVDPNNTGFQNRPMEYWAESPSGEMLTDIVPFTLSSSGACTPSCAGKECGPDGCGGACGFCSGTSTCSNGSCTSPGTPGAVVCGDINSPTIWTLAESPIRATCNVNVSSSLTIEPGVVVEFETSTADLIIENGATLFAEGTAQQPIIFTSDGEMLPESWGGVYVYGKTAAVTIKYAEFRYGGATYAASGYPISIRGDLQPDLENIQFVMNRRNAIGLRGMEYSSPVHLNTPGIPYFLEDENLTINQGVTMTIDPGVILKFKEPSDLVIHGRILAVGTSGKPIYFTSFKDDSIGGDSNADGATAPGTEDWGGIYVYGDPSQPPSEISNAVFRYGGEDYGSADFPVITAADSELQVSNTTFQHNRRNAVGLITGSYSTNAHLGIVGTPYYIENDNLTVNAGVTMTIEPGVVIKAQGSADLVVNGRLVAVGTSIKPIIFTSFKDDAVGGDSNNDGSTAPAAEDWGGIYVYRDPSQPPSEISHAIFRYAGEDYSAADFPVITTGDSMLEMVDVVMEHSRRNAVGLIAGNYSANLHLGIVGLPYYLEGEDLTVNSGVTMTIDPGVIVKLQDPADVRVEGRLLANGTADEQIVFTSFKDDSYGGDSNGDGATGAAAQDWGGIILYHDPALPASELTHAKIRFAGEDYKGADFPILVSGRTQPIIESVHIESCRRNAIGLMSGTYSFDAHLNVTDIPYYLESENITINSGVTMTIDPGVVLKLQDPANLIINGRLVANGTEEMPISFTSFRDDSIGGDSNADGSSGPASEDWGGIILEHDPSLAASEISNALFRFGGEDYNGADFPIRLPGTTQPIIENVVIESCRRNAIGLETGTYSEAIHLNVVGIPYYLEGGDLTVNEGVTMTIDPGVVLKFHKSGSSGGDLYIDGTLISDGTPENPIVYTSHKDDGVLGDSNADGSTAPGAGNWGGIYFSGSAVDSSLRHAVIRFGGADAYGVDCAVRAASNSVLIEGTQFEHNHDSICVYDGGAPDLGGGALGSAGGNLFLGHSGGTGDWAVRNETLNDISAMGNWWGATVGQQIDAVIFDKNDNASKGLVIYDSFQNCIAGLPCSDGDPCTSDDTCTGGYCIGAPYVCTSPGPCETANGAVCDGDGDCTYPATVGAPCNDEVSCTYSDQCSAGKTCEGIAYACVSPGPCETVLGATCDGQGDCNYPFDAGNACDDGNACTPTDVCAGGGCQGSGSLDCDDSNVCTTDSCEPSVGCVHANNALSCDDGNPCTTTDQCIAGSCQGSGNLDCDDSNLCTDDSCEPGVGCLNTNNTLPCDDGNACTVADSCSAGSCHGAGALDCDDSNLCTDDSCIPSSGCLHIDNSVPCDDGDLCTTTDVCTAGICEGSGALTCDDSNPCTDDSCSPTSGCTFDNNSQPCDDGDACTTADTCSSGACLGSDNLDCDDKDVCTDDSCEPATGCIHVNNTSSCDDGDICTPTDLCSSGTCHGSGVLDCTDDNPCTDDICSPETGCVHLNNVGDCDDGNICTQTDLCSAGTCLGSDDLDCDDNNECTDDSCDPITGCVHTNNALGCDDGDVCTTTDICAGGVCLGSGTPDCDDGDPCTLNLCNPVDGCNNPPVADEDLVPCDDGDLCTHEDSCIDGVCTSGSAVDCDDGVDCTDDKCIPDTGACSHTILEELCDNGNSCTDDWCNPTIGCQHSFNVASCDDGNPCTATDLCSEGTCVGSGVVDCDDENPCTVDSCDPVEGCVQVNNDASCDDGDACTTDDACVDGACTGAVIDCDDDNPCTVDVCFAQDGVPGCLTQDEEGGLSCDDGDSCTFDDVCTSGACVGVPVDCDDENPCMQTGCQEGECVVLDTIPACCVETADCAVPDEACDTDTNTCFEVACLECAEDADCGAEGNLCVALPSGDYCTVACDASDQCGGTDQVCDTEHTPPQCVPAAGDCECVADYETQCLDGQLVSVDTCGQVGDVLEDCGGPGCFGEECCPEGTHATEQGCVPDVIDDPDPPEPPVEVHEPVVEPLEQTESLWEVIDPVDSEWEVIDPKDVNWETKDNGTEAQEEDVGDDVLPDGGTPETVSMEPGPESDEHQTGDTSSGGCTAAPVPPTSSGLVWVVFVVLVLAYRRRLA